MSRSDWERKLREGGLSRREILRMAGGSIAGLTVSPLLGGCGDEDFITAESLAASETSGSADWSSVTSSDLGSGSFPTTESAPGSAPSPDAPRYWYFAIVSDSHVIDEYYEGPESNQLDTESILEANRRFVEVRDFLNAVRPRFDHVFHLGDLLHTFPSPDLDFYDKNRTSIDIAAEILEGFESPFRFLMGNHDYYTRHADREVWHELFASRFPDWRPYHSVDHRGLKFVFLNNYLGATHDRNDPAFDRSQASFGEEQLLWLQDELEQNLPTFVFLHEPVTSYYMLPDEFGDFSIRSVLSAHRDNIEYIICGHLHRWFQLRDRELPRMMSIGSTRYSTNSFVPVQVDAELGRYRFLNEDLWRPGTVNSRDWDPESIEEPEEGW